MKILLTGAAGFIGYHATKKLCSNKRNRVIGIDSLNSYYDKKLMESFVERSLKNIQTINPKINDEIEASRSPCLNDLILFLISVNNLLKLNFVESIEGLLSLLVLILSPPS